MKKILVLVLALVMMFSLTACGGEKIGITTENWQDYFEIKQEFAVIDKMEVTGEIDGERVTNYTMLCLKEEYADRADFDDIEMNFVFMATNVFYEYSLEDGVVVKGEKAEYDPVDLGEAVSIDTYIASDEETDELLKNEYNKVVLLPSYDFEDSVGVLESIVIGKVEGTLVLE